MELRIQPCLGRCAGSTAALQLAVLGPPLPSPDILTSQYREKQASWSLHSPKSAEQSENVYENKGAVLEDSSGNAGRGGSRTAPTLVGRVRNSENKARMSMKIKDDGLHCGRVWRFGAISGTTVCPSLSTRTLCPSDAMTHCFPAHPYRRTPCCTNRPRIPKRTTPVRRSDQSGGGPALGPDPAPHHGCGAQNCVMLSVFPSGSLNHATRAPLGEVQIPRPSCGIPG